MYRMHQCGVGSNIKFYCLFLAKDSEAACEEAMVGSGGHQSYCQSHGKALPPTTTATSTNRLVDNILLWNEEEGSSTTQSAREYNELWKSKFKDPMIPINQLLLTAYIQCKLKLCKAVTVTSCEWSDAFINPVYISNKGRLIMSCSEPELLLQRCLPCSVLDSSPPLCHQQKPLHFLWFELDIMDSWSQYRNPHTLYIPIQCHLVQFT